MFGFGLLGSVGEIVIGVGIVIGCIAGLCSREGMYDRESTGIMTWSQLLGIVLGALLTADGLGLLRSPVMCST
jgi:hypothetical protein